MGKKCISAILLAALSLALLAGGMELCREPEPLLIREAGSGLWQVSPDGGLTFLTKAYRSVVVDGVAYLLDNEKGTWCVLADGEVIVQGEPSEETEQTLYQVACPFAVIGSMTELDGWLYFLLSMEDNTDCLCRVRTDGTGFEMFPEYDVFSYELLTVEGRVVLRVRTEKGVCPAAFDPETKTFAVLSETPANISNRYYVDGDQVWWTYDDQETATAVQCSVPVTGGETETLDLEIASFVGGGNLLIGSEGELQVMDIRSGKTETYDLPFEDFPEVVTAGTWGAVIGEEHTFGWNYWLLDYDTGAWTQLALE